MYRYQLEVTEQSSGRVFARASELVFGGDLHSVYMKLFGGNQDYQYLSCGYVSAEAGPWRPSSESPLRVKQYADADVNFQVRALRPRGPRTTP